MYDAHIKAKIKRFAFRRLLTNPEFLSKLTILIDILLRQIIEQLLSFSNHGQQGPATRVIFIIRVQVFGKTLNPVGKQCNLTFYGAGVARSATVFLKNFGNFFLG